MTLRRMTVAIVVTMVAGSVSWAGTVYDAYPGDNLNVMDEVLTYGDTLVIHEGDYWVDDTDPILPAELLPENWPGPRLRAAYHDFATELAELRDTTQLQEAT